MPLYSLCLLVSSSLSIPSLCLSVCLSIYLSIYLSVFLFIYLSVCLSIYLSQSLVYLGGNCIWVCLQAHIKNSDKNKYQWSPPFQSWCGYLSALCPPIKKILDLPRCPYIYLSIYLSVCLFICLSVYLSVWVSIYQSVHLFIYLTIFPNSFYLSVFLSPLDCFSIYLWPTNPIIHLFSFYYSFLSDLSIYIYQSISIISLYPIFLLISTFTLSID